MIDLSAEAWEQRYQESRDRWDLGCPAPPLINLLASAQAPQPGRMAVLGCGSGQDAMLFSVAGFDVVGFDFAPSTIAKASTTAKARELSACEGGCNVYLRRSAQLFFRNPSSMKTVRNTLGN
ncbi:thiol methyltransferase 1-like protein [Calothrix sp. NIES-4101]|nr:thiol methyltransferase 1-like protein [Calothrix sp. NIES-4101]